MCSTSRKRTFPAATTSDSPATSATIGIISGMVSQMVSRVSGMASQVHRDEDDQDRDQRDEMCGHGGEGRELARKANLLDQVGVVHERPGRGRKRPRKEHPDRQARKEIQRGNGGSSRREKHREHQRVDPDEDERVDQRPEDAEKRPLVFHAKVAAEQVARTTRDAGGSPRTPTSLDDCLGDPTAMSALVSAIAFHCAAVIWIALRTPLASRLTAKPSEGALAQAGNPCTWGDQGVRGDSRRRRPRHRGGRGRRMTPCSRSSAARDFSSRSACSTMRSGCRRWRSWRLREARRRCLTNGLAIDS